MHTTTFAQQHALTPAFEVAPHLLRRFQAHPAFEQLFHSIEEEPAASVWARGLSGSARSMLIASLAEKTQDPLLVIVPDATTAEDLRDDLAFLLGPQAAAVFPDPGLEPYRAQHPKVALRAGRIEALAAMVDPGVRALLPACARLRVLVATAISVSVPVPKPESFQGTIIRLHAGQTADLSDLIRRLVRIGYVSVPLVGEYGDISRRGGILDVYSFGRENPVRVEFDGDEVVSLREFDPFSQRSLGTLPEVALLPLWEWLPGERELTALLDRGLGGVGQTPTAGGEGAKAAGTAHEETGPIAPDLLEERLSFLEADGTLEGIEWSLSFFGDWRGSVFDYLGARSLVVIDGPTFVRSHHRSWVDDLEHAWKELCGETAVSGGIGPHVLAAEPESRPSGSLPLPPAPPADVFWLWDRWEDLPWKGPRVYLGSGGSHAEEEGALACDFGTHPPERFGRDLEQTRRYIVRLAETAPEVHILCDTDNHRERLADLLASVPAQFHVGNLGGGFVTPGLGLAVLTDHEIFSRLRRRTAGRRFSRGISLKELLALTPGDYVVHIDHGIGLYRGLERLTVNGQETDCIVLEYSGGDRHYVPVDQLSLVQKYSAEEGHRPQLSRLGGKSWARTKERVKKSIKDMAGELLRTYALRKARKGIAFTSDTTWLRQLEMSFPFDETPDQIQAIEDVKRDMEQESPMDRLICGDVGYGKTEVAIRAAFKAVQDVKQAAVLVPTTLLARQHYDTFKERLKEFPVRVDFMSRYRTPGEVKEIKADLKEGKIDIIIGTHALLAKDVGFRDLGLVVVDEEQLFGVAAKEKLKRFRATVDVLTMTATPIPRTMHLAMMGGRDMSTILTPPRDRRPIQTEILEFRDDIISHALMREADRGGQSFFVHNRVETIDSMASYLGRLVPHLRLAVAHGQMRERALESVMSKFLAGEYDVLVSTMIIESGLDLPNVNTILINRGDTFGLAQLYQLRGRVGRSSRKAYAFLLVPPYHSITEQAQKRLKAMEEFEDLGSGYQLALRDLEIRGAGNLLGAEQHGFIVNVGFELYCQLLEEAVRELKGESKDEYVEPRMSTDIEAYLPDDFVPDPREKMNLYKSLADARSLERVEEIAHELTDRFGRHPEPVRHLLGLRRIRILGAKTGCEKVTVRQDLVQIDLGRELKKAGLQRFMQAIPFQVEFLMGGKHRIRRRSPGPGEAVSVALIVLRGLEQAG
jgi:transcription-repair coupling factor (superfamily II helicase)